MKCQLTNPACPSQLLLPARGGGGGGKRKRLSRVSKEEGQVGSGAEKLEMQQQHWWNYEEGVAGARHTNREDPRFDETRARCSQENKMKGVTG